MRASAGTRVRREIVAHAVRWANNMLVEVIHNHGGVLSMDERNALADATRALNEFQMAEKPDPGDPEDG